MNNSHIYGEDLVQTLAISGLAASLSVSPYKPCLVDLVSHIPSDFPQSPLVPTIIPPPLSWGSLSSKLTKWRPPTYTLSPRNDWLCVSTTASIWCQRKALWEWLGKALISEDSRIPLEMISLFLHYHHLVFVGCVWFFPRSLGYSVSTLAIQAMSVWAPSCCIGLKLNGHWVVTPTTSVLSLPHGCPWT